MSHADGKTVVTVAAATVIWAIKQQLEEKTGITPAAQELLFAGRALDNQRTVDDYNLLAGTTLHMIAQTRSRKQSLLARRRQTMPSTPSCLRC